MVATKVSLSLRVPIYRAEAISVCPPVIARRVAPKQSRRGKGIGVSIFGIMKKLRLDNKIRKACQGRARGFTMIEVVIAIALIGLIAVAVMSALATASIALIIADERATAESLARSQLEYVKNSPYDETNNPPEYSPDLTAVPDGYDVDIDAIRLNPDPDNPPEDDDGIQKITVTVSRDGEVKVTLEGYKREPVT